MNLLHETFNDEVGCRSFIDELDRFDEFDIECISRDFDEKKMRTIITKEIDVTPESIS